MTHLPLSTDCIAVVAITKHGIACAGRIVAALPGARLYAPEKFAADAEAAAPGTATCYAGKTGDQVPALLAGFDGLVFVVSLGAVMRLLAPHLGSKESDPGVVVVDEGARFCIPMLSGHLGGANALAAHLAAALGAQPVYTTASDARATLAADIVGREFGWRLDAPKANVTRACAAVVNDLPVAVVQEAGWRDWWPTHADGRSGPLPANLASFARIEDIDALRDPARFDSVIWIAHRDVPASLAGALADRLVRYRPPRVAVGIGCDRGTPVNTVAAALDEALALAHADIADVTAVASIDLKADESALQELAARHGWHIAFHSAAQLAEVEVPNPSETVRKHTGTPSVSEAAALLAAGATKENLIVEKHKRRGPDGRNATISVARVCEPSVSRPREGGR